MTIQELEAHWNNKYPKNPVLYNGRAVPAKCPTCSSRTLSEHLKIDVKTMLSKNDSMVADIALANNLKGASHDQTIENIQRWVVQNIKYVGDDLSQGTVEYWQFPFETLAFKNGDCEDGALLITALALHCGVPAFRIRVVAGMVQPAPTAPEGGHGYVSYLRETDNNWVAIDWCYLEDSNVPMASKTILKQNAFYKSVWFSFNSEYSWSEQRLEFSSF